MDTTADARSALLARLRRAVTRWPDSVNPQELHALSRELTKVPDGDQFNVLAEPFVDASFGGFLAQQYAGLLLASTTPLCSRPVIDVLRDVLPNWNRSIEELPLYLEERFGRDVVLAALDELDRTHLVDPVRTQTVRYWLGV